MIEPIVVSHTNGSEPSVGGRGGAEREGGGTVNAHSIMFMHWGGGVRIINDDLITVLNFSREDINLFLHGISNSR